MTETKFLTPNIYSRPQKPLHEVQAVVMHWTEAPQQTEKEVWQYFENRKQGKTGFGSAHYIIGQNGNVLQCIPENEIAYHCGSSVTDPRSGKIYTDFAREKFKKYCIDFDVLSPNLCTIGIELCPIDKAGFFSNKTIESAIELVARILNRNCLDVNDIITHNQIVGWKNCPKLWTEKPDLLEAFKQDVQIVLKGV